MFAVCAFSHRGLSFGEKSVFCKIVIIPPALWASGGFGLACQHPSPNSFIQCFLLEEGFSPPPTSSPGLWTGRSRGLVTTYIQFFRHPGHHHFFIIFPTPFYIDSCSILAPNLLPKSLQNPVKIDFKSDLENYQHLSPYPKIGVLVIRVVPPTPPSSSSLLPCSSSLFPLRPPTRHSNTRY